MRLHVPALVVLLIAGCGGSRTADTTATSTGARPAADAQTAAAPKEITLTDQTVAWECPKCGMDFDGAGQCTMDGTELVRMDVAYTCPADNQPVASAGKCPRCNMNAKVVKTAAAAPAASPAATTN